MKFNSIRWRLAFSYAVIALLAAFSLGFVLRTILRNYYDVQEVQYLHERATQIGLITAQLIDANVPAQLIQEQSVSWSFVLQARVKVEDPSGRLIADSGVPDNKKVVFVTSAMPAPLPAGVADSGPVESPQSLGMDIVQAQPAVSGLGSQIEIVQAQPAESGFDPQEDIVIFSLDSVAVSMPADVSMYGLFNFNGEEIIHRSSQTVEQRIIGGDNAVLGKLILSDGPAYGDEILNNVMNGWVAASIVAVLLAAFAGWFLSNRITSPVTTLTHITSRMASGDLSARVDITGDDEIGVLGRSFNDMASRVEEMVGTLRSFVSDAAHELHTPLTALQTNLELARDEENASDRTLYLDRVQEQSQRLEALVRGLLDLSRIEATDNKSNFVPLNLSKLLRGIAEPYASRAEQSNRTFELNLPETEILVVGNEMRLHQVFVNLLENALKFTADNDMIRLSATLEDERVVIEVADTGIGIPPEDLPNMFKRFHRGRNVSDIAGNGLGLAIVKAVIEAHDGKVDVASAGVGCGSAFRFVLHSYSALTE